MSTDIHIPENVPEPIKDVLINLAQSPHSEATAVAEEIAAAFEGNEPDDPYEYAMDVAREIAGWAHAAHTAIKNRSMGYGVNNE